VNVDEMLEVLRLDGGVEDARAADYVRYHLVAFEPVDGSRRPNLRFICIYCHNKIDKFIKHERIYYGRHGNAADGLGEFLELYREVDREGALALFVKYGKKPPASVLGPRAVGAATEPPAPGAMPVVATDPKPPGPGEGIDYGAIAVALLAGNRSLSARLVEHMAGRDASRFDEIIDRVYEGEDKTWGAVRTLVNRTNNSLFDLEGDVRAAARQLRFVVADHVVMKRVKPN
jgi:hypothetical protein